MTALICQVTCTLCSIEIDETKCKEHLTSENHSKSCKNVDDSIAKNIFEMIFEAKPGKNEVFNIKNEKTLNFGVYIFQGNYQERILIFYVMIQSINWK